MNHERKIGIFIITAVMSTIASFHLVLSGIGSFINSYGQAKVSGWDNWFVDMLVWLSQFTISLNGPYYFLLTITVFFFALVVNLKLTLLISNYSQSRL